MHIQGKGIAAHLVGAVDSDARSKILETIRRRESCVNEKRKVHRIAGRA
jgi:hypothetical protein